MFSSSPIQVASSASRTLRLRGQRTRPRGAGSRDGLFVDVEQRAPDRVPVGQPPQRRRAPARCGAAAPRRPRSSGSARSAEARGSHGTSTAASARQHLGQGRLRRKQARRARPRRLERDQAEALVDGRVHDRGRVRVEPLLLRLVDGRQVVHRSPTAPGAAQGMPPRRRARTRARRSRRRAPACPSHPRAAQLLQQPDREEPVLVAEVVPDAEQERRRPARRPGRRGCARACSRSTAIGITRDAVALDQALADRVLRARAR